MDDGGKDDDGGEDEVIVKGLSAEDLDKEIENIISGYCGMSITRDDVVAAIREFNAIARKPPDAKPTEESKKKAKRTKGIVTLLAQSLGALHAASSRCQCTFVYRKRGRLDRRCPLDAADGDTVCAVHGGGPPRSACPHCFQLLTAPKMDGHIRFRCAVAARQSSSPLPLQPPPPPPPPYFIPNCNLSQPPVPPTGQEPQKQRFHVRDLMAFAARVERAYDSAVRGHICISHRSSPLYHEYLRNYRGGHSRFNLQESGKHSPQVASIVQHTFDAIDECVLGTPPLAPTATTTTTTTTTATVVVEVGAGKGDLGEGFCGAAALSPSSLHRVRECIFIDRRRSRIKAERRGRNKKQRQPQDDDEEEEEKEKKGDAEGTEFVRINMDIKDVDVAALPGIANSNIVCMISKHLCGAATDVAIRAGCRAGVHVVCIALCCHHLCTFSSYPGLPFLRDVGLLSTANDGDDTTVQATQALQMLEWEMLKKMSSWGVSGPINRDKNGQPDREEEENEEITAFNDKRTALGRMAKRLLDFGRLRALQQQGYSSCRLVEFVDAAVSPENCLLVAARPL